MKTKKSSSGKANIDNADNALILVLTAKVIGKILLECRRQAIMRSGIPDVPISGL
jgi:hypothetical protein